MKSGKIFLFPFLLLLMSSNSLFSQNRVDSLESLLDYSEGDEKIKILIELSELIKKDSSFKPIGYLKQAMTLARESKNQKQIADVMKSLGREWLCFGELDSAEYYCKNSFEIYNELDEKESLVYLYIKLSCINLKRGKVDESLKLLEYALGVCEQFEIDNQKDNVLIKLAEIYYLKGELTKAIVSSFDALDIANVNNDKNTLFNIHSTLGNIYLILEDFEKAYEFYMSAFNIAVELNQYCKLVLAYNNLGKFYLNINLIDNAWLNLNKSMSFYTEEGFVIGYEYTCFNWGQYYFSKKDYNEALEYFNKSLKKSAESHNIYLIQENYMALADVYLLIEEVDLAFEYIEKGKVSADNYKFLNEYKLYFLFSEYYNKKEDYKQALTYHQKYIYCKDSILNSRKINTVAKIKTTNELHRQKNAILSLINENEQQNKLIESYRILRNVLIIGTSLVLILLVLLLRSNKNKKRANRILKKQNKEIIKKNFEIEEQAEYLKKLNQEHEKLSIAASKTDNAIIITDTDGEIEWINEGYTRLYGFSLEEFPDKRINKYSDISTNDLAAEIFYKAIEEKQSQTFESDVVSKNGIKHRIQTTLTPILDDKNEVIKLIAIDSDVSKLKEVETELQKLLVTKDKFFSIIAHDLKNPFNSLIGLAQLLVRGYNRMSDEKLSYFLNNLYQISKKGYELLINLLEWSRSQMGSIHFEPLTLNLHALTEETFSLYSSKAGQKEILLVNNLDDNTEVFADQNMIKTIFRNLVSNALKFTDRGGVIEVSEKVTGDFKEISIRDTGIGIKPGDIDKLFKLDENFTTEGTEDETGTGLGLLLCKEFVERHGGEIWVESKPGNGSKFIFTLPKEE